jgi:hypothetical protein
MNLSIDDDPTPYPNGEEDYLQHRRGERPQRVTRKEMLVLSILCGLGLALFAWIGYGVGLLARLLWNIVKALA